MSVATPLSGTSLRAGKDQAAQASPPALPQHKGSIRHPTQPPLAPAPWEPTPGWARAPSVLGGLALSQLVQQVPER